MNTSSFDIEEIKESQRLETQKAKSEVAIGMSCAPTEDVFGY
jgi:hypothetical protein